MKRVYLAFYLALVFILLCAAPAEAAQGDVFETGLAYGATTYNNYPGNHPNIFCKPQTSGLNANVCDITTLVNDGKGKGAALYAPEKGTVEILTQSSSSWGNSVYWISADGRERLHLAHLHSVVASGPVNGGDLIGYVGTTGKSTGVHLHISREYDGKAAPVILSGVVIEPTLNAVGLKEGYVSKGPVLSHDPQDGMDLAMIKKLLNMKRSEIIDLMGSSFVVDHENEYLAGPYTLIFWGDDLPLMQIAFVGKGTPIDSMYVGKSVQQVGAALGIRFSYDDYTGEEEHIQYIWSSNKDGLSISLITTVNDRNATVVGMVFSLH